MLVTMLPLTAAWGTACPVTAVVYPEGSGTVEGENCEWDHGDHSIKAVFEKVAFTVTNDSRYRLQSGKKYVLTVKRTVDEDAIVDDLVEVKLAGKILTKDTDYTVTQGSAVVTIAPKAMNKLSTGKQTITITFRDGDKVTAKVKILDALDDQSGTGDNSHLFLWLALAALGMLGLGALYRERRRLLGK